MSTPLLAHTRRLAAVWFADIVGYSSLSARDEDGALRLLERLHTTAQKQMAGAPHDTYPRYDLAQVFAIHRGKGQALDWLDQAYKLGWRSYRWGQRDPALESLRSGPRFQQLTVEIKADVDRMRARVERERW